MRMKYLLPVGLLALISAVPPEPKAVRPGPTGDYAEARTCSVFAGACHYNAERVSDGREAVFGFKLTGGSWRGVDLTGVVVAGEITCEDNLAETSAARKTTLVVDAVTDQQVSAVVNLLRSQSDHRFGTIVVTRGGVEFTYDAGGYRVRAAGLASLNIRPMPGDACCTQPHSVWYEPLMPLVHRKAGFTESAESEIEGDRWERGDENGGFYGAFSIAGADPAAPAR